MASGSSIKPPAPDGMEPLMVSDAVEDTDKPLSAVPAATAGDERWDASAQKVGMSGAAAAAVVVDAGDESVAPTTSISNPKSLPTPTKSETKGGSGGTARDIEEKPMRLTSLMIGYLGLVDAFSFSYIDQAGKKHSVGPWGEGYHHDKIETISFDPLEFVEEVFGTYGSHFGNILVMSLTFVTNVKTYGPFGNPNHQNVPATPFRFMADEGSCIVGFHGRSGSHLFSIGVYMTTVRALSAPVILKGQVAGAVQEVSQQETKQMESRLHHMPLQQLKDITNNFCHELGRGGFGVVYKGMLENGQMVAVKKLVQAMPSSQEQFENELNLLMNLKHQNIVRLLGYCYEMLHSHMPHQGKLVSAWNVESLLCLECLTNGSLDRYISGAASGLDWPTRCKIIEGISYGLQYLHEQSNDPIVHLDLKPANILLDENMVPKITDFGLSRLFDQKQTIFTAVASGTLGYMPPEYLRGIITPKSDIFSLGVIIMEVITGHREYPYDIRTSSKDFIELELQKWRNVLQKEPGNTSLETDCQQIRRCLQIGLICVNPERTKRPAMKKIIDMLEGLESLNWYISNELSSHDTQADP